MLKKLPTHGFLWKVVEDFTSEKIDEFVKKDKKGYLLEVDVEYPKEMHKNHNEVSFLVKENENRKGKGICSTHQNTESSIKASLKIKKPIPGYEVSTQ